MAPHRTVSHRSETTREAFASRRRDRSVDLGRQHSLAHQASARLNMLAAKRYRLVSSLKAPARRQSARQPSHIGPFGVRIISSAVSQTVPGAERYTKRYLGTGRRSGSKPPLRVSRARRWPWRDRERRWILQLRRIRRCTGRLNATQPGVLAFSTSYIRGSGLPCKGSVREASLRSNTRSFSRPQA